MKKENNQEPTNNKMLRIVRIVFILLLILSVAMFARCVILSCNGQATNQQNVGSTNHADPPFNSATDVKIPMYSDTTVTHEKPNITFFNCDDNITNLKYVVKDKDGGVVYESHELVPGETLEWNAYADLSYSGSYTIVVSSYKNGVEQNGIDFPVMLSKQ